MQVIESEGAEKLLGMDAIVILEVSVTGVNGKIAVIRWAREQAAPFDFA